MALLKFFAAILALWIQLCTVVQARPFFQDNPNYEGYTNSTSHGNQTKTEDHPAGHKIKVAKFDFKYIATPFIVTVWVLLASLLKVGMYN